MEKHTMHNRGIFRRFVAVLSLATVGAVAGCGTDGPPRFHVKGQVTFAGKTVPAGTIVFEPDLSQGNDGPQGMATIQAGFFDTNRGGRPTVGGPHRVTILGCDGV